MLQPLKRQHALLLRAGPTAEAQPTAPRTPPPMPGGRAAPPLQRLPRRSSKTNRALGTPTTATAIGRALRHCRAALATGLAAGAPLSPGTWAWCNHYRGDDDDDCIMIVIIVILFGGKDNDIKLIDNM